MPRILAFGGWGGLLLAGGILAPPASGQAQPLTVTHTGPDTVVVAPGARRSVAFQVANERPAEAGARLTVGTPEGWRVVAPAGATTIGGSSAVVRILSFVVPSDASPGTYSLSLAAAAEHAAAADQVHVRVPAQSDLRVHVEDAPQLATAGEAYAVRFRVVNAGNLEVVVRPELQSARGFAGQVDTSIIRLRPGSSVPVVAEVRSPKDLPAAVHDALRLRLVGVADTAEAVAAVEVVPGGRASAPPRPGLPAEVRLRASADPRAGPPVRVQAAGPLRHGSSTRVEVLLQGPSREYSMFGEADVYRLRLQAPAYSLKLGDDFYRLSRLTEPGQEGFGVAGSARAGALEVGGFVQRDRRSFQPDTQLAAFAGLSAGTGLQVRANWLRSDSERRRREVVSGEAVVRIPDWLVGRGELGWRPSRDARAHEIHLTGARGPLTAHFRHSRGDTAFGGIYAGLTVDGGHLALRPWGALYVEGSLEKQAIERTAGELVLDDWRRSMRAAAGWGSRFALEANRVERISASSFAPTDHRAQSVRLRFGLPVGPVELHPFAEVGTVVDRGAATESGFWHAGLHTRMSAGRAGISAALEYFRGGSLHRVLAEEGFTASGSASFPIGDATQVLASAYGSWYRSPVLRSNLLLDGRLEHHLPFGHVIAARILQRSSTGLSEHAETMALLDYSIPLEIPTGGGAAGTSVTGRVFDAETGAPLRRVVLRVGDRRIATDSRGRIVIRDLRPGRHAVHVDRGTLDPGRVPAHPMPLTVDVRREGPAAFEIPIVTAGTLVTTVTLSGAGERARVQGGSPEPIAGVLVEFRSGGERIRRETNARGMIELPTIRPGAWEVTVVSADLPPFHRFERDEVLVRVAPGQRVEIGFEAVALERRVQIVATGEVTEEGAETAERAPSDPVAAERPGWTTFRTPMTMRVQEIAWLVYRDAALWPKIWAANRALASDPDAVPMGTVVDVPPAGPLTTAEARAASAPPVATQPEVTIPTTFRAPMTMRVKEVAWLVYRNPDLWPKIWLANRDLVDDPDAIPSGTVLRIPPPAPLTPAEEHLRSEYLRSREP